MQGSLFTPAHISVTCYVIRVHNSKVSLPSVKWRKSFFTCKNVFYFMETMNI